MIDERTQDRFWRKVRIGDGCWEWTASRLGGYGGFSVGGHTRTAHRVSYEMAHGPIPEGAGYHGTCVLHKCDNKLCVRPSHLFLGTAGDNNADMMAKGRQVASIGVANGNSKHSEATVSRVRELWAAGWRQTWIARELGIGQPYISKILLGKKRSKA